MSQKLKEEKYRTKKQQATSKSRNKPKPTYTLSQRYYASDKSKLNLILPSKSPNQRDCVSLKL